MMIWYHGVCVFFFPFPNHEPHPLCEFVRSFVRSRAKKPNERTRTTSSEYCMYGKQRHCTVTHHITSHEISSSDKTQPHLPKPPNQAPNELTHTLHTTTQHHHHHHHHHHQEAQESTKITKTKKQNHKK